MRSVTNYFYLSVMAVMIGASFLSGASYTYLKDEYEKRIYADAKSDILMKLPLQMLAEITIEKK